jgi:hypothetical protein
LFLYPVHKCGVPSHQHPTEDSGPERQLCPDPGWRVSITGSQPVPGIREAAHSGHRSTLGTRKAGASAGCRGCGFGKVESNPE